MSISKITTGMKNTAYHLLSVMHVRSLDSGGQHNRFKLGRS